MTHARSLAVAQTCPRAANVAANVEQHLRLADAAGAEGAQITVFPELSLTGYELESASALAFSERDARLSPLRASARAHAMTLIVGAPVRIGSKLHIGAVILHPDGTTDLYTKHRLGAFSDAARGNGTVPPPEATVFAPGDRNPLIQRGGTIAALAICADIGAAWHPQRAADMGANAYLAGMFVIPSELEGDLAKLRGHAVRHTMTVAFANFGGPSGGLASGGRTSIWSASGELLVQLDASGAGVAVVTTGDQGRRARRIMLPDL